MWTADKVTKNMQCGRYYTAIVIERYYSVDYTTYSGIETDGNHAAKARHEFTIVPRQIPGLTRGSELDPRTPRYTATQKKRRGHRLAVYRRGMAAARRAYFRRHWSPKTPTAFVHRQQKRLHALQRSAGCIVPFT